MQEKSTRMYAQEELTKVYKELGTSENGLTKEAAETRLEHFGPNTIKKAQRESEFKTFIKNFLSLMAILLWISGFIAIFTGTPELGIAIWAVTIINGVFSYYQEHAAKKSNGFAARHAATVHQGLSRRRSS